MQHPPSAYDSTAASNEPPPVPTEHNFVKRALKDAWRKSCSFSKKCLTALPCFGDSNSPQQQEQQQESRRPSPPNQSTTSNTSGLSSSRELSPSPPPPGEFGLGWHSGLQFVGLHLALRDAEDSASESCTSGNVDILANIGR